MTISFANNNAGTDAVVQTVLGVDEPAHKLLYYYDGNNPINVQQTQALPSIAPSLQFKPHDLMPNIGQPATAVIDGIPTVVLDMADFQPGGSRFNKIIP